MFIQTAKLCVGLKVKHVRLRHKRGLSGAPLNQRELSIQDAAHAERHPPKWLTERQQHPRQPGNRLQSRGDPRRAKTAGPVYSHQLPFCVFRRRRRYPRRHGLPVLNNEWFLFRR